VEREKRRGEERREERGGFVLSISSSDLDAARGFTRWFDTAIDCDSLPRHNCSQQKEQKREQTARERLRG
jgi:hypothetical protein